MKRLLPLFCIASVMLLSACSLLFDSNLTIEVTEIEDSSGLVIEQDETAPLLITDYHVNEARFNPSVENPAALNMMASMTLHNTTDERLEVRYPRFNLSINGVEWTELVSTDFQIGRLQPDATQTIELQSLMLVRRASEEQLPILDAISNGEPLDLEISGVIQAYPDGEEQTLEATIILNGIILPGEWGAASGE